MQETVLVVRVVSFRKELVRLAHCHRSFAGTFAAHSLAERNLDQRLRVLALFIFWPLYMYLVALRFLVIHLYFLEPFLPNF
jgi:hypothetical protein